MTDYLTYLGCWIFTEHSIVTVIKRIILTLMKLTFLSLWFPIHIQFGANCDITWNDELSAWTLVRLDEAYPKLYIHPSFLLFESVGNLFLPVLKEKWGLYSTVLSPNYLDFTLEDKSGTFARHLFRRLPQLEIQEEQICCSIPTAGPDTVSKKRNWLRTRWKLWTFRLISSGSSSWKNPAFSDVALARWKMSIYLKTERFVLSYSDHNFFFAKCWSYLLWYKHKDQIFV